jgi:hypothetical protein
LSVKLHRETADIAGQIGGAFVAGDGGEANKGGCLLARPLEEVGSGDVTQRLIIFEVAMSTIASRMYNAFRDALVIEVKNLLTQMEVFECSGSARSHL